MVRPQGVAVDEPAGAGESLELVPQGGVQEGPGQGEEGGVGAGEGVEEGEGEEGAEEAVEEGGEGGGHGGRGERWCECGDKRLKMGKNIFFVF